MSILDTLLGKPLASSDEEGQKIGVTSGVAILGLDGLSSAAYGPEAALTLLLPLGALGLNYIGPITGIILALLAILYFSYRQTITAYPSGGGSYTVAKENLGIRFGLLAAAALMLDYTLNVAVGISAGIGALVSAVPSLHPHILALCLGTLALITLVNLRGVRESGLVFSVPTYLFVGSLGGVLIWGVIKVLMAGGHPIPVVAPPDPDALKKTGVAVSLWLLVRSFSSGCTAMTGVEAVSNGVGAFANPAVKRAQQTLTVIVAILGALLLGIAYLARVYHVGATDPDSPAYQSILSQLTAAIVGRGPFYYLTIGSVLAVLALSANTSYSGFPRLGRLLAQDEYLPHAFGIQGRRLVYSLGIGSLTLLAGLLLIVFGGITDRLIPLFAIGAFLAFTLSQTGMVMHWRRVGGSHSGLSLTVNAVGAISTGIALMVILVAKFSEGAWITLLLIPMMLASFLRIKQHYTFVRQQTECERPLDLSHPEPPYIIVPVKRWDTITEGALRFALTLSPDVLGLHIQSTLDDLCPRDTTEGLPEKWKRYVEGPIAQSHLSEPRLMIVESPYRLILKPLLNTIDQIRDSQPDRTIAVVIPELVEKHWIYSILHNQRATALKAALLLSGAQRVVVINVPWYIERHPPAAC